TPPLSFNDPATPVLSPLSLHDALPIFDSCPRFMSEYGFQAMPGLATIREFAGEGPLAPDSPVLKAHQKFLAGEGNARLQSYIDKRLRPARDLADFVYLCQVDRESDV